MNVSKRVPVIGFVAFSGTGKTTLLSKIVPLLSQHGLRVGIVKHAPHGFDIDRPGKDSYVLREAGAVQTMLASSTRWALMTEAQTQTSFEQLLSRLDHNILDCVLVEGFKQEPFPKIELYRHDLGHPLLYSNDRNIIAIATDGPLPTAVKVPVLDLNDPAAIASFLHEQLHSKAHQPEPVVSLKSKRGRHE
ncbi:MAG: molybdopterin-guanine dinucleotide biosynthesis protein B [Acidiferrobacterales bacterium]